MNLVLFCRNPIAGEANSAVKIKNVAAVSQNYPKSVSWWGTLTKKKAVKHPSLSPKRATLSCSFRAEYL